MATKQIHYGVTNFASIMTNNIYHVDKTKYIEMIVELPKFLFLRCLRHFVKSPCLNTLDVYYNVTKKNRFDELFGNLYIGEDPTGNQNKYLILSLNLFSPLSDAINGKKNSNCGKLIYDK